MSEHLRWTAPPVAEATGTGVRAWCARDGLLLNGWQAISGVRRTWRRIHTLPRTNMVTWKTTCLWWEFMVFRTRGHGIHVTEFHGVYQSGRRKTLPTIMVTTILLLVEERGHFRQKVHFHGFMEQPEYRHAMPDIPYLMSRSKSFHFKPEHLADILPEQSSEWWQNACQNTC